MEIKELLKKPLAIVNEFPPNIYKIREAFDLTDRKPVFSYGGVLYVPYGGEISDDLMVHELTHRVQQENDPKGWWDRYIEDTDFRLLEELEAYSRQYISYCSHQKDRNNRAIYLHKICSEISSKMYGNMIEYGEAMKTIRNTTRNLI